MSVTHVQARSIADAMHHRAALDALSDAIDWAYGGVRCWRQRVHERAELARLDERSLRDIGLTRADAEFLINKPFWRK
jgi:uncharacterized protein YjiS (DUF1127 family)